MYESILIYRSTGISTSLDILVIQNILVQSHVTLPVKFNFANIGALVATEACTRCGYFNLNQAARDPVIIQHCKL